MRERRCYTPQTLNAGDHVELDQRAHHHLVNVLRMRAADTLVLFNGDGQDYPATLIEASRRVAVTRIDSVQPNHTEAHRKVTLLQAIAKGERMDWVMQKATELGVHAIQPLQCERGAVNLSGARLDKRLAHWQGVVISACEQCGRSFVPPVLEPCDLGDLESDPEQIGIVLHPGADQTLTEISGSAEKVRVAIGPEGGFSDSEAAQLESIGYQKASLGQRILRTETAAIAALAVLNLR